MISESKQPRPIHNTDHVSINKYIHILVRRILPKWVQGKKNPTYSSPEIHIYIYKYTGSIHV